MKKILFGNNPYISERTVEVNLNKLYLKIFHLDISKTLYFELKYLNKLYTFKTFEINKFVNTYRLLITNKNLFYKNQTEIHYFKNQRELNILFNKNYNKWIGNILTIDKFIESFKIKRF